MRTKGLAVLMIAAVLLLSLSSLSCGDSSPTAPGEVTPPTLARVLLCFFNAATTSYNAGFNEDIMIQRDALSGLSVRFPDPSGNVVDGITDASGCINMAPQMSADVTIQGNADFFDYTFTLSLLVDRYLGDNFYFFAIPNDQALVDLIDNVSFQGNFVGMGPNRVLNVQARTQAHVADLNTWAIAYWGNLAPIDLDPYINEIGPNDGSIVTHNANATAGGGVCGSQSGPGCVVALVSSNIFATVPVPIGSFVYNGATIEYRWGLDTTRRVFEHEWNHVLGLTAHAESGSFAAGGGPMTNDEVRALRMATNLSGFPVPSR